MGIGGQRHAPVALPPGKWPSTRCIGGSVGPRAVLDGYGKPGAPTGIRSHDRPARSESLFRQRHPGSLLRTVQDVKEVSFKIWFWEVVPLFSRRHNDTLRSIFRSLLQQGWLHADTCQVWGNILSARAYVILVERTANKVFKGRVGRMWHTASGNSL